MNWVLQVLTSVIAFVSGMLCLVQASQNMDKEHSKRIGGSANIMMAFISIILAIGLLIVSPVHRNDFQQLTSSGGKVLPWVISFSVLSFVGNMVFFNGLVNAPNPSLARALATVDIAILAILTCFLFQAHFSWIKTLGIVFASIGAVLVSL